ncbi:MAG: hypothetical protein V1763_01230 [Parcubacteria group bacterium]
MNNEEKVIKKLEEHDQRFERLELKFIEHDAVLAQKPDKSDLAELKNEILGVLDGMNVILKGLDQERVFTAEWIRRVEQDLSDTKTRVERNGVVIDKVKMQLGIA